MPCQFRAAVVSFHEHSAGRTFAYERYPDDLSGAVAEYDVDVNGI